jgi:fumarate reductase flavoprotein subunit
VLLPIALLLIIFTLAACSSDSKETKYKEGTYIAESSGHNGSLKVEVTFSKSSIEKIAVIDHKETAGLTDMALERIPSEIIKGQTLAVESVSGATITSKAILEAVKGCIVMP